MYFLTQKLYFPPVENASPVEGLLAIGGNLSIDRLLLAYKNGIFPWYNGNEPILWWAPPQRMVVYPKQYKAPKSLRNIINQNIFEVTFNKNFDEVIKNCQKTPRKDQDSTWISNDIIEAYTQLHELGKAFS